jgi:methionyl-tRNA synthetase
MTADRPLTVVIAATPTPNGDLHAGHLAGPYLAGDVFARYRQLIGHRVVHSTCTDDSQSYVLTTARRRGLSPEQLVSLSTAQIASSLAAVGSSIPGLPPVGEAYRRAVLDFLDPLYAGGVFEPRTVAMPYATRAGQYLYDGLVSGTCPTCLAGSSGGGCESCGHPNHFDQLLDPHSSTDPSDPLEYRDVTVLVLPLENFRDRLTEYYAACRESWRPHARQLIDELMSAALPEVPVTVPGSWGICAPYAETPGQILYPWIEAMPACLYSTWWAAGERGPVDADWRAEAGAELVYFHGYDNVYAWGLVDLVLLMAHGGKYTLPAANVCNEFYELAGSKFSTSRNHVVWTRDLLADTPRDLARFYLALTAPEFQRTTFDPQALRQVGTRRLVQPWNRLRAALTGLVAGRGAEFPTTADGRARAAAMAERFRGVYELPTFTVGRVAETIAEQLDRLLGVAGGFTAGPATPAQIADLLLQVRTLLTAAAPILVDTAEAARAAGVRLGLDVAAEHTVTVFELPHLAGEVAAAADRTPAPAPRPATPEEPVRPKLLAIETRQYLLYYISRYRQVQELGVDLYVLNGEGTPDFWPADHYRLAGSKHIDDIVETAVKWHADEQFDGVITFSESAVITVAAVAEALGLPGISVDAAVKSRNKYLMRQAYEAEGAPIPGYRLVPTAEDALAAAGEFGYPVILKPTLGAGSHFVFKVDTPQELVLRHTQAAAGIGTMFWATSEADGVDLGPNALLVESFLDGREYLIEGVAWDGEVYLGSVVDRITAEGGTFDDDVHHAPSTLTPAELARVREVVAAGARAQGLDRSAMHAEIRYHNGEPHLLEIAARVGGGGLDMIARLTAEHDPIRAVVEIGAGTHPTVRHFTPTGVHITAMCLLSGEGVVDHVDVPADISESERVFLLKITARPGDLIRRPPNGNTILGFLGVTGDSLEDCRALMDDYAARITVTFA